MKIRNVAIFGGVLAFVAILAWGLSSGGGNSTSNAPGQQSSLGTSISGSNPESAPDIKLAKLGGGTVELSEYRGKKPVVVDFWASWCPNCRRDMPNLNRYYEKYKDQIEVIGINLQERENIVSDFVASQGFSFPIALDPKSEASNAFGINYTNTHFLINKDGKIIKVIPGDIRESDFQALL